jgi:YebC/PmpR family DNA-binding regulatory protein
VLKSAVRNRDFRKRASHVRHSKWHTIKHKKGAADAKRGKIFTRIIKELTVAARNGGGDPDTNPRLRTVIADAKAVNMPADNIKRAIRRGTGEEEGVTYEEVTYEGYGPGGVAILIEALTDNKNRTVGEIRPRVHQVGRQTRRPEQRGPHVPQAGQIVVEKSKAEEEALMSAVLEAGADDMTDDGEAWEIVSAPDAHQAVLDAVKALGIEPASAAVAMLPSEYIKLEGKQAQSMLKLMEALEDHDDTKNVWSNFDVDEKEIEASLA